MRVTASGGLQGRLSAYLKKVLAVSFSLFKATTQKSCNGIGELRLERENYALKYEFVWPRGMFFPLAPYRGGSKTHALTLHINGDTLSLSQDIPGGLSYKRPFWPPWNFFRGGRLGTCLKYSPDAAAASGNSTCLIYTGLHLRPKNIF